MFCCGWYIFANAVDRVDATLDSSLSPAPFPECRTLLHPLVRLLTRSGSVLGGAAVHLGRRRAQDPRAHHGDPCHRGKQTQPPLCSASALSLKMAGRVLVLASCYAFCAYLSLCAYSHDLCVRLQCVSVCGGDDGEPGHRLRHEPSLQAGHRDRPENRYYANTAAVWMALHRYDLCRADGRAV
jgi:hypothetical protein